MRDVLQACMDADAEISQSPNKPFVRLADFGTSSLDFECVFWSDQGFAIMNTTSDLRFRIFDAFARHGIQIPFPQTDVHIRTDVRGGSGTGSTEAS